MAHGVRSLDDSVGTILDGLGDRAQLLGERDTQLAALQREIEALRRRYLDVMDEARAVAGTSKNSMTGMAQ